MAEQADAVDRAGKTVLSRYYVSPCLVFQIRSPIKTGICLPWVILVETDSLLVP
jgi:hypothetical protein